MFWFHLSKFVKEDLSSILKRSWGKLLGISVLIGFLLFLLNIFLGLGMYANHFSTELKDKLGMYFYIQEDSGLQDQTYKEVMTIKDELEAQGLKVMFSSKDDALAFLQKKIPDVVDNFQKFGIDNPLPATLYVMFASDDQYDALKTTILKHQSIILNATDVHEGSTIKQQENRVLNFINLSNLILAISYTVIVLILLIIFAFLGFLLKDIFTSLHKEFEVKKMMGAHHQEIVKSFVMITMNMIVIAFAVALGLLIVTWVALDVYLQTLFALSLLSLLTNVLLFIGLFILEIVVVSGVSVFLAYYFTKTLHQQIPVIE